MHPFGHPPYFNVEFAFSIQKRSPPRRPTAKDLDRDRKALLEVVPDNASRKRRRYISPVSLSAMDTHTTYKRSANECTVVHAFLLVMDVFYPPPPLPYMLLTFLFSSSLLLRKTSGETSSLADGQISPTVEIYLLHVFPAQCGFRWNGTIDGLARAISERSRVLKCQGYRPIVGFESAVE